MAPAPAVKPLPGTSTRAHNRTAHRANPINQTRWLVTGNLERTKRSHNSSSNSSQPKSKPLPTRNQSPGIMASANSTALSADVAVKVSTEAAQKLVDSYYRALQSNPSTLAGFYMVATIMPDGTPLPSIVLNGNVIPSAAEMQNMFENEMPAARYEVQSFDCQVMNPNYIAENAKGTVSPTGKNMAILVIVSGYVKYGESRDVPMRGFSENFVLVPNPDVDQAKSKGKHVKDWLIQSQNFRLVV